jgi:competence protein ComEC
VVFTAGYRNPFGHPHPDVVKRYQALGAAILRSDRDGAVRARFRPRLGMEIVAQRQLGRRYWHAAER